MGRDPAATLGVALGGGIGAVLRYQLGLYWGTSDPSVFPWTTLTVNLLGALLLGLLMAVFLAVRWKRERFVHVFVGIGILGGFTTFSTFAVEAVRLTDTGHVALAFGYMGFSLLGGLAAVFLGVRVGGLFRHRSVGEGPS